MIIDSGFNVIFAIFEFIIMKRNKTKKGKSNIIIDNKIIYISTKPKQINIKDVIFLIIFFIIYYCYFFGLNIFSLIYPEQINLISNDGTNSFEIAFFLVLSKLINKSNFYMHQYISMIIMILLGITMFILNLYNLNYNFNFPLDLFYIFLGLIISFLDSIYFFIIKKYMEKNIFLLFLFVLCQVLFSR